MYASIFHILNDNINKCKDHKEKKAEILLFVSNYKEVLILLHGCLHPEILQVNL